MHQVILLLHFPRVWKEPTRSYSQHQTPLGKRPRTSALAGKKSENRTNGPETTSLSEGRFRATKYDELIIKQILGAPSIKPGLP